MENRYIFNVQVATYNLGIYYVFIAEVELSCLVDGVAGVSVIAAAAVATTALAATSLSKKKPSLIKQVALNHQPTLPSGSFLPTSIPCPRIVADAVGFSFLGAAQYGKFIRKLYIWRWQPLH